MAGTDELIIISYIAGTDEEKSLMPLCIGEIAPNVTITKSLRRFYAEHNSASRVPHNYWGFGDFETVQTKGKGSANDGQKSRDNTGFFSLLSEGSGMSYRMDSLAYPSVLPEVEYASTFDSTDSFSSRDSDYRTTPPSQNTTPAQPQSLMPAATTSTDDSLASSLVLSDLLLPAEEIRSPAKSVSERIQSIDRRHLFNRSPSCRLRPLVSRLSAYQKQLMIDLRRNSTFTFISRNTKFSLLASLEWQRRLNRTQELKLFLMLPMRDVDVLIGKFIISTIKANPATKSKSLPIEYDAVRNRTTATTPLNKVQCRRTDVMTPPDTGSVAYEENDITESARLSASRIDSWIQDVCATEEVCWLRSTSLRDELVPNLHPRQQPPPIATSMSFSDTYSLQKPSRDETAFTESHSPSHGTDLIDELGIILLQLQISPEASWSSESESCTSLRTPAQDGSEESGSQSTPCTSDSSPFGMTKRTYSEFNVIQLTSESDTSHPSKSNGRENGLAVLASTLQAQESIQMPCPCDDCFGTNSTISELLVRLRDRHQIVICRRCCELVPIAAGIKPTDAQERHNRENCALRCIGASCAPAGMAPNPHLSTEQCKEPWTALRNEVRWRFIHLLIHPDRPAPEADFQRGPEFQHSTEKKLSKRQPAASKGQVILNQLRGQILRLEVSEESLKEQLLFANAHVHQLEQEVAEVKAKTETDHAKQIETLKIEHAKAILALEKEQSHKIKTSRRIVEAMVHLNPNIPPFVRAWIEEEFPGTFSANGVNSLQEMLLPREPMFDYDDYTNALLEKN